MDKYNFRVAQRTRRSPAWTGSCIVQASGRRDVAKPAGGEREYHWHEDSKPRLLCTHEAQQTTLKAEAKACVCVWSGGYPKLFYKLITLNEVRNTFILQGTEYIGNNAKVLRILSDLHVCVPNTLTHSQK